MIQMRVLEFPFKMISCAGCVEAIVIYALQILQSLAIPWNSET